MTSRLFRLSKLAKEERLAISCLRGSFPSDMNPAGKQEFDLLRQYARGAGVSIGDPAHRYLGQDEIRLLAWLAVLQRQQPPFVIELDETLRRHALKCARLLHEKGAWLGYHVVARVHGVRDQNAGIAMRVRPSSCSSVDGLEKNRHVSRSTLQGKALLFASQRGNVPTREFQDIGVSRQIISMMVKRGLLRRVSSGVYRAEPDAVARLRL